IIMAIIIDGKSIAGEIRADLKEKTQVLFDNHGIRPGLGLILAGNNPSSEIYVSGKAKACEEIGYYSVIERLPESVSEAEILNIIKKWNEDEKIHGILVQLPLPKQIDETKVLLAVGQKKDVDGFHPENLGRLMVGLPGFISCTPAGIMELISRSGVDTQGKHVVVVGRSNIVGKPIANLLYQKNKNANAVVTIAHTGARDLSYYTKQADILIAAAGSPLLIKGDDVKEGVVVIDVGTNRIPDASKKSGSRLVGDVDFQSVEPKAYAITPVPGGVGPMTIAMLLKNTFIAASAPFC
ncbi:MAG: Bifunctional protein FolD, partial [Bacteroidota bacterium]|nr:Bifunctional protein FolD [Bacteroidota bacterium]